MRERRKRGGGGGERGERGGERGEKEGEREGEKGGGKGVKRMREGRPGMNAYQFFVFISDGHFRVSLSDHTAIIDISCVQNTQFPNHTKDTKSKSS